MLHDGETTRAVAHPHTVNDEETGRFHFNSDPDSVIVRHQPVPSLETIRASPCARACRPFRCARGLARSDIGTPWSVGAPCTPSGRSVVSRGVYRRSTG